MKRIVLFTFLLTLLLWTNCFAYQATPRTAGMIVNDSLLVLAVNINGPAYSAGIRPGDIFINTTKDILYKDSSKNMDVQFNRGDETFNVTISPRKILDEQQTTYLIIGDAIANYSNLMKVLKNKSDLSTVLSITNFDDKLKMINTYSKIKKKDINGITEYIVALGGNCFGLKTLETFGNMTVKDYDSNWSVLELNYRYRGEYAHLIGTSWIKYKSSGILERETIEDMFVKL